MVQDLKRQFVLTGFSQVVEFRVFAFEWVAPDGKRTSFSVKTDINLARHYGIQLQELPLLCRVVLERPKEDNEQAFIYTEDDMRIHASDCKAAREAAKQKRRPPARPVGEHVGAAWRGQQPAVSSTSSS